MIAPAAPSMLWKIGYRVVNIVRFQSDVPARDRGVRVVQSRTYHGEGNVVLVHQISECLPEAVTADRILEIARARGHPEELPRPLPGDGAEAAFLIFLPRDEKRFEKQRAERGGTGDALYSEILAQGVSQLLVQLERDALSGLLLAKTERLPDPQFSLVRDPRHVSDLSPENVSDAPARVEPESIEREIPKRLPPEIPLESVPVDLIPERLDGVRAAPPRGSGKLPGRRFHGPLHGYRLFCLRKRFMSEFRK